MTNQSQDIAYFTAIDEAECIALLRAANIGRVAWCNAEGINVMPVNFSWHEGKVIFHTSEVSPLAALREPTEVGFQIDEIDEESRIGWSVLVRGITAAASSQESVSWVPDNRHVGIAITATWFGGRVVSGHQA